MSKRDLESAIDELVLIFEGHANAEKAQGMHRYMKGLFSYLGIQKPQREILEKPFISAAKNLEFSELEFLIRELWNKPEREYQYLAIQLMRNTKIWRHKQFLKLAEWLLQTKPWWDSVDMIAARIIGPYFLNFPDSKELKIQEWKNSDNLWLNRTAILYQLKYKEKVDKRELFQTIRKFSGSDEFFIQKAIGWALRELSYLYPNEVSAFCEKNKLKPLSKREALRVIMK